MDKEILEGYQLPTDAAYTRAVNRVTLLRFLTNPMNWVYFNPERIGVRGPKKGHGDQCYDHAFWAHARRLVLKKKSRWNDEWWPIGKVAKYHKTSSNMINHAIHKGKLPAVDWGNWRVLKSHATDPLFKPIAYTGKGGKGFDRTGTTPAAKAFMVLAEAVGLMHAEIGALMGWKEKRVYYQLKRLQREGHIPGIIKEHRLKVGYDKKTGKTFASWRVYADRFPRLARKMDPGYMGRSQGEKKQLTIVSQKADRWQELVYGRLGIK